MPPQVANCGRSGVRLSSRMSPICVFGINLEHVTVGAWITGFAGASSFWLGMTLYHNEAVRQLMRWYAPRD